MRLMQSLDPQELTMPPRTQDRVRSTAPPALTSVSFDAINDAMRTTVTLDDRLVEEASEATGEMERSRLIHDGLRALIARENARAIIALGGSDQDAWIPARRRPAAK